MKTACSSYKMEGTEKPLPIDELAEKPLVSSHGRIEINDL